ncbi:hypothetical protein KYI13_12330 (plasmid) [Macrococcoides bohemicum]|uniref:YiiX/YebB-like N1pC/P60 family cysteine hydrolase n=1 Tax=Macrococcoides bohemicum TaxID=1903056 RepID=UPI001C5EAB67|nr:YiiX/YebB-like N1pC/P60 family cysteine hydrolase [Macrococcus bohemicus]QYA46073.1 hypothetical protein KYI13_12330 [Macrococcus bohemicus]
MKKCKSLLATTVLVSLFSALPMEKASAETHVPTYEEAKALEPEITKEQYDMFYKDFSTAIVEDEKEVSIILQEPESDLEASFTPKAGDIIYTNNAFLSELGAPIPGHAAIYVGDGKIVEINGYGHIPATHSYSNFVKTKRGTKSDRWIVRVYRTSNTTNAIKASTYAKSLSGKNIPYGIFTSMKDKSKLYCSKLVWQAYYFGAGSSSVVNTNPETVIPKYLAGNIKGTSLKHTYR